jgi:alanyl-tRNA synthetase
MGLERISAVVQGVTSNYDTDLFKDLIRGIETIAEKRYGEHAKQDVSFRVISDHARATAFLIGDGVLPSNEGRGYVLRRIIRRAIRFGQVLGIKESFLHRVAGHVIDLMGEDYPELATSRSFIDGIVLNEERRFADTLHFGMKLLMDNVNEVKDRKQEIIPGSVAFKLYDTYGLSLDIVQDVAREEGLRLDLAAYDEAMTRQRTLSQESWKGSGEAEVPEVYQKLSGQGLATAFVGYETLISESKVVALLKGGKEVGSAAAGEEVEVVLDRTPFYGEAGGQVGDKGWMVGSGVRVQVTNTVKLMETFFVHRGVVEQGSLSTGARLEARVDEEERRATELNHTATHLLHAALRETLGPHVKQAGSLVSAQRFRFDFSHFAQVDAETLRDVEHRVNRSIRGNLPLTTSVLPREEAMKTGAMAIFEERYGENVRLVSVGDGVSLELCGGTHTHRTGDVGLFKIVSESAVGANVRRIEALTGKAALEYVQNQELEFREAAFLLKTSPEQLRDRIDKLLKEQRQKDREIEALKSRLLSAQSEDLLSGVKEIQGARVLVREVQADSPKDLRDFADRIKEKFASGIIVLGARKDDKAMLLCMVTKDLVNRFKAGEIISRLSQMLGGKGGGRPDMAQGGGSRPELLGQALESVGEIISK